MKIHERRVHKIACFLYPEPELPLAGDMFSDNHNSNQTIWLCINFVNDWLENCQRLGSNDRSVMLKFSYAMYLIDQQYGSQMSALVPVFFC
jgi:hypothetical protein